MKTALLALALAGPLVPHDFFVSILTLRHSADTHTLDLTWRMTAHDVEHALVNVGELKLGTDHEHPKADSLLNAYFHQHLVLMQARQLDWRWVGKEMEGETLYCYLQVDNIESPDDLLVQNTLLMDLFYEQQNIVHVEWEGHPTRSHTFIQGSGPHAFEWQ
jgi:hypothetical protein